MVRKELSYSFYRIEKHPIAAAAIFRRSTVEWCVLSLRHQHVPAPGEKFFVGEEIIEYVNSSVSKIAWMVTDRSSASGKQTVAAKRKTWSHEGCHEDSQRFVNVRNTSGQIKQQCRACGFVSCSTAWIGLTKKHIIQVTCASKLKSYRENKHKVNVCRRLRQWRGRHSTKLETDFVWVCMRDTYVCLRILCLTDVADYH